MNNYEKRVSEIAEEMARKEFNISAPKRLYIHGFNALPEKTKKELIASNIEYARIAVKFAAEEAEAMLLQAGFDSVTIIAILKERGLIPPPEAEKEVPNEQ